MIQDFTIRQLSYFQAVAQHGSIRSAAERLRVSESAISSALTQLERGLGRTLLVRRKGHGAVLTADGENFLRAATRLLREWGELRDSLDSPVSAIRGTVRVGSDPQLGSAVLAAGLDLIAERHPAVISEITFAPLRLLTARLETGEIDVALVTEFGLPQQLRFQRLFGYRIHAALSPSHPLAPMSSVELSDLIYYPLVALDIAPHFQRAAALFDAHGLTPMIGTVTDNLDFARSLVARGHGYTIQAEHSAGDVSVDGLPIVVRPISPTPDRDHIGIAWSGTRGLSRAAEAWLAAIRGLRLGERPFFDVNYAR